MTTPHDADDRLKDAFRALVTDSRDDCSDQDVDRVWSAVSGDLPAAARRDVVDALAGRPALADAWRAAHELRRAQQEGAPLDAGLRPRAWTPVWLGLAALLVLSVGVGLVQFSRPPADTYRAAARYVVEPLVTSDAPLPRDQFVLRWKAGPEGSRYQVRVMTEDLRVLTTAADLTSPELTVPRERLSDLAPNARVLWQVVVALPGGDTVSSPTFVVRAQ